MIKKLTNLKYQHIDLLAFIYSNIQHLVVIQRLETLTLFR